MKLQSRRRFLLTGFLAALTLPLLRFIGYNVPRKPEKVRVDRPVPQPEGVLTTPRFILFEREERRWALSRRCTHLGCSVNYHEAGNLLECPCHQSRFAADTGAVLNGPATRPLSVLPVEKLEDGGCVVTIQS